VIAHRVFVLSLALLGGACAHRGLNLPAPIPAVKGPTRTIAALEAIEITPGTGAAASYGQCVYAHYTGWLTDGTKFDSSRDTTARGAPREPIVVPIGFRRVILGWDVGFDGLQVGGQRRLIIPQQFAYGPLGRPPVIPPAATLIFDIELLAVRDTLPRASGAAFPGCTPWAIVSAERAR
jgi:peptidylprolyl isomerase